MNDIARLSFAGGGMILPVRTSYECELLVEHVEAYARRHGHLRLDIDRRRWTIRTSTGFRPVCVSCSQWPDGLAYPGGSTGGLSVISSLAEPCTDISCELNHV